MDKTEVSLVWNKPDRDGGSPITGYLVEYKEEGTEDWIKFKTVTDLECVVTGLQQGKTYKFRVKAENIVGLSLPDTTIPIECQEKLGNLLLALFSFFVNYSYCKNQNLISTCLLSSASISRAGCEIN